MKIEELSIKNCGAANAADFYSDCFAGVPSPRNDGAIVFASVTKQSKFIKPLRSNTAIP